MTIKELFGKTITNIYATFGVEQEWLDTADCFIELDNNLVIAFPFSFSEEVWVRELDAKATTLFNDLSDYPVYHVNKEGKSIGEIAATYQKQKRNIFNRIKKAIFGQDVVIKEYQPYKVEYKENKAKYIQGAKISDFLWYDDESEKGLFLLENGYVITETRMSPSGTGLAGLNYYESLQDLESWRGNDFKRLSENEQGSR
ncbi:hypothetical protein FAM09_14940 [Niastella caeni]|uniref:Uncharacterized protein n=1 Tax=Niastella caeni TaxID=2569763 RepID=A0A4S8HSK8_9BACT|nr:hypothetical protein [Niastella caeni]THU37981.1 hypothetical protein FAM09_14940 [Niastella caeni]